MDFTWTEEAFGMLERGELRGEVLSSSGIVRSRVWGPCPRCGHAIDDQQTLTAIANLPGAAWRYAKASAPAPSLPDEPAFLDVDVSCGCGATHSGAPATASGCGVSFRVELPVRLADPGK
jgi:hypothetical protein